MLPLLPQKSNQDQLCHDVNPLIREIFQGVFSSFTPLPDDVSTRRRGSKELPHLLEWGADIKESQGILELEREVQCTRVKELIAERRSNLYRLEPRHEPLAERKSDRLVEPSHDKPTPSPYTDKLLTSDDLLPPVELRKCPNSMLWMRNMAAARSQQCRREQSSIYSEKSLRSISTAPSGVTSQSVSVDEIGRLPPRPPLGGAPVTAAPPPLMLRAVPLRLHFVNCFVGRCYTKTIRLINVSKYATRLSITPPRRSELDVQLGCASGDAAAAGARYAGGVTVLHVHFTPKDVREIQDELRVRARGGAEEVVRIRCYVEPPVLHVSLLDEDAHPTSDANITELSMLTTSPEVKNASEPTDARRCCVSNCDTLDLGAMLMGSVRRVDMELYSSIQDVSFFILSEDGWINRSIENMTQSGTLLAEPFVLRPTYFSGGIIVPGNIWCAPECFGIHVQSLRILSTTAVVREVDILVDALYFQIGLVRVVAEEKNFDICAEEDTRCEQYLNLGVTLPGRQLTKTIEIVNDSPVAYAYYWAVRPWGVCLCEYEDDVLGPIDEDLCSAVLIEPSQGKLLAQSTCAVDIVVPDVGRQCGTRRAIIILVLKNIPRRSFPNGFNPSIVSSRNIAPEYIPGTKDYTYEACDIICGSVEVWWRVELLKVIVRPPRVRLPHSHRVPEVEVECTVTRLAGPSEVSYEWRAASDVVVPPDSYIAPQLHATKIMVQLTERFPSSANIQLVCGNEECISNVLIERYPQARAPDLMPTRTWRGVVLPSQEYEADFTVHNVEPHQVVCTVTAHRDGSIDACAVCNGDPCSCNVILPRCMSIQPHRQHNFQYHDYAGQKPGAVLTLIQLKDDYGALTGQCSLVGVYVQPPLVALKVITPPRRQRDADNLTRAELGWRHVSVSCDCVARFSQALTLGLSTDFIIRLSNYASLAAFYLWQPPFEKEDPLVISMFPSEGVIEGYSSVDIKVEVRGTRLSSRRVSFRTCALRDTRANSLKPIHLLVEAAVAGIAVSLDIPTGPEGEGRVRIRRGVVPSYLTTKCMRPLYTKKVSHQEIKASDSIFGDAFEEFSAEFNIEQDFKANEASLPAEKVEDEVNEEFAVEEESLKCEPSPPDAGIAENPDTINLDAAFPCIQFTKVPLRTVQNRLVRVNNDSELATTWTLGPSVFPRVPTRTRVKDKWAADCKESGVCVQCVPCEGLLAAFAHVDVRVEVYVDTWGVYCEHLKYEMSGVEGEEGVEGSVDVWVQAAGSPLDVMMQEGEQETMPTVWFTQYEAREEHRQIRVRNVSHAPLRLYSYLVTNHHPEMSSEMPPRPLPFRVLLRFQDTDPCECSSQISALATTSSTSISKSSTNAITLRYSEDRIYSVESEDKTKKMGTGIILFLAPDYGHQNQDYFKMQRSSVELSIGEVASLQVSRTRRRKVCPLWCPQPESQRAHSTSLASLPNPKEKGPNKQAESPLGTPIRGECSEIYAEAERKFQYEHAELASCLWDHVVENQAAPPVFLLIEMHPLQAHGPSWHRGFAGTLAIQLREQSRAGQLHLNKDRLQVRLCAAALPQDTDLSVRKKVRVQNTGTGILQVIACAESPWTILTHAATPALSRRNDDATRSLTARLHLPPGACEEVAAELCVRAADVVPIQDPYPTQLQLTNYMHFFQEEQLLKTLILELLLEYPQLSVEPKELNIGVCTLGQSRKEYLSFTHSSRLTLDFIISWSGGDEVKLHPTRLRLAHKQRGVVYVQYAARCATAAEGEVTVTAASASWCAATVRVCARADHDRAFGEPAHCRDYTDDIVL